MNPLPAPETEVERHASRPRYGLSVVRDIVIAPSVAFEKIAASREWVPAYGVIVVASVAATLLYGPALLHIAAVTPPPPGEAAITTANVDSARQRLMASYALDQAIMPLAYMLLTASALTTVARFKRLTVPYVLFLSLAANCMVPSVIGGLLSGLLVRLHDPASFHDLRALLVATPTNLAVFSTPGNNREIAFLAHFDIFEVWGYVLLAFGFVKLVPVSFTTALVVAFGLDLLFALLF